MATVSSKIKMLLGYYGKRQTDLIGCLNMSSRQSVNNKMARDSWSAQDLAKVAEFVGCRVAFVLQNGQYIYLDPPELKEQDSAV